MTARIRFKEAAAKVLSRLDDRSFEMLAFMMECAVEYKEHHGYSVAEMDAWESEAAEEQKGGE